MTTTYIVSVPSESGGDPVEHTIQADVAPTIVSGQGLTFQLGGSIQAPSPFLVWHMCTEQAARQ